MKLRNLFVLLFVLALSPCAFSQSVIITGKKTIYRRPKPISEYKKIFTVNFPRVKAATPALSRKIQSTISYAKVLELNIKDEINDVQWLEEADYEVGYNKNGILCITLSMNGSGAYPSGTSKTVIVDLKTGNRVTPENVFTDLGDLAAMVKKAQQKEVKDAIVVIKKDPDTADVDVAQLFENTDFQVANLDEFALNDRGITFIYDYGFAHVVQALQPDGNYKYTWSQLKRFIKKNGLLARYVR